jgi:hypothetical protein
MTTLRLDLSDSEYQRFLQERLETLGTLGDVFPLMVSRNVPQYVLRKLWPERWEEFVRAPRTIMFAAAEEGWRGRLENVQARAVRQADGPDYQVSYRKTYVMNCEAMLLLARPTHAPDDVSLVWIDRNPQQEWTRRTEPGLSMECADGTRIDHWIVTGDHAVPAADVCTVAGRTYALVATQLPRREISSMALLAVATLRRHGLPIDGELLAGETRLCAARDGARLSGAHMNLAGEILREFFGAAREHAIELHPLWDRIREMAKNY